MKAPLVLSALILSGFVRAAVEVEGNPDGLKVRADRTVALPSNAVCLYEIEANRRDSKGTVLAGTVHFTMGEHRFRPGETKVMRVLMRTPEGCGTEAQRLGSYACPGGAVFGAPKVTALEPRYGQVDGVELGAGETLDGDVYRFATAFESPSKNDARPLVGYRGGFYNYNDRWGVTDGTLITYCHRLPKRRFVSATIGIGATYRASGAFAVEVSADDRSWRTAGTVDDLRHRDIGVPRDLLPAERLFVRLRGLPGGNLQIHYYTLAARFEGPRAFGSGSTAYVRKGTGETVIRRRRPALFETGYGEVVGETETATLWRASSGWKVARRRPLPAKSGKGVAVRLAANESESAQLVVTPRRDLADVRVTGSVAGLDVEIRRVGWVPVKVPSDGEGAAGDWPDPLPPQDATPCAVRAGENQPFWITVSVPKGTPAGVRRGELVVSDAASGFSQTVPFAVEVFGFELPDEATLQSNFTYNPAHLLELHRAKTPVERKRLLERYSAAYASHRVSPGRPAPYHSWEPTWDKSAGDGHPERWEPVFDWTAWDAEMERLFATYHFNAFNIRPMSFWYGAGREVKKRPLAGIAPEHPAYPELMRKYLGGMAAHLEEKGWLDKAYFYWFDEPAEPAYADVMAGMKMLRDWLPGVRRLLTEQPEAALADGPNLWCPMPHNLHTPSYPARRAAGDQFWWYLCTEPICPYFTDFTDRSGAELRQWGWQTWKERITGILMWETTHWNPDPYADPMLWKENGAAWANGDGTLFYPPRACLEETGAGFVDLPPVPSQRLALIRDAVEDYEYCVLLNRLDPGNAALTVPDDICRSLTDFSEDPEPTERHRLRLARTIERARTR